MLFSNIYIWNIWKNLLHFLRLICLKDDSAHNFWIVNNSLDQCIGKKVWFYLRSWFILYIHLLPFFELKRNKKFRLVSYILTFVWLPNSLEVWMTDDLFIWCILKSLQYDNITFVCRIYQNILPSSFYNRMVILLMRVFDFGAFIALQCLLMHDLHATHKIGASGANWALVF